MYKRKYTKIRQLNKMIIWLNIFLLSFTFYINTFPYMSACLSGNRKRNEKIVIHTLEFTRIQVKILTRKNWGNSTKLEKRTVLDILFSSITTTCCLKDQHQSKPRSRWQLLLKGVIVNKVSENTTTVLCNCSWIPRPQIFPVEIMI